MIKLILIRYIFVIYIVVCDIYILLDIIQRFSLTKDFILQKTLAHPSPSNEICIAKETRRRKNRDGQKEGRSAGDSCQSFRRFSRRILSATPGARIRIRTESQRDRGPADFEYAGALGNGKLLQWV